MRHEAAAALLLRLDLRVGGFTCVLASVSDERGGDGERHAAQVALVWFLSRVPPLVVRQRAGLSERLTTDVADVRLLATVQPAGNVRAERPRETEDHSPPHKRWASCRPDVDFVVGRRGEFEAAALAGVGFLLSVVHPPMGNQLTLLSKAFVAVAAIERFLTCEQRERVKLQVEDFKGEQDLVTDYQKKIYIPFSNLCQFKDISDATNSFIFFCLL